MKSSLFTLPESLRNLSFRRAKKPVVSGLASMLRDRLRHGGTIEALEDRIAPASFASFSGGVLSVSGDYGGVAVETLTISYSGALIHIVDPSHTITAGVGVTQNGPNEITVALTAADSIQVNTGSGADNVAIAAGLQALNGLTIQTQTIASLPALTIGADGLSLMSTGGAITQTGILSVTGPTSINAGSNAISLNAYSNHFVGDVSLNNSGLNDVAVTNDQALSLGTSTIGRNLTVTADGNISQTGILTVSKTSSFSAGAHTITLGQANVLTDTVTLSNSGANDVTITNTTGLKFATSNIGSGMLTASATTISQTGAITQEAGAVGASLTTTSGTINLSIGTNLFTGPIALHTGTQNVSLTNGGPLVMDTSDTGSLTLSGVTSISQIGALSVTGAFVVGASVPLTDINLASQANDFSGSISFIGTKTNIDDLAIRNTNASASITGLSALTNLHDLTLIFDNGNIAMPAATLSLGGNLSLKAGGNINQPGTLIVPGTTTLEVLTAGKDILLGTRPNEFTGTVILAGDQTKIRDFSLQNTLTSATLPSLSGLTNLRNLTVNFSATSLALPGLSIGGSLSVTASGDITQTGGLVVPLSSSFSAGGAINLPDSANAFTGAVTLNNVGGSGVVLQTSGALSIGASSLGAGPVTLTGVGISQTAGITQTGTGLATFNGGAGAIVLTKSTNSFIGTVVLNNSAPFDASITNSGALSLGASTVGGNLATVSATLTQTGALVVPGTTKISIGTAGSDVLLGSQLNNFGGAISFIGTVANIRDVSIRNINAGASAPALASLGSLENLTLLFDNAGVVLPATTLHNGGNLVVNAGGGAITQTGAITQQTGTGTGAITFTASSGSIVLSAANDFTGAITASSAGAGITINDNAGGMTVTSAITINGPISLSALNGTLSVATATAGGPGTNISLIAAGSGDVSIGALSAIDDSIIITAAGAITDSNGGADNITANIATLTASSGIGAANALETAVASLGGTTLTGGIGIANTGIVSITGLSATTSGDIAFTNIGATTVNGAVSAPGGKVTITTASPFVVAANITGTGDILLSAGEHNDGAGPYLDHLTVNTGVLVQSTAGSVTLRAGDDVNLLSTSTVSGIGVTIAAGYADSDSHGGLLQSGAVNSTGAVSLTAIGNITLGEVSAAGQTVTIASSAGGIIDGNGGTNNVTANTLALSASTGIGSGGALETTVANLSGTTTTGGISLSNTGAVVITGLSAGSGNIGFSDTASVSITGAVTASTGNVSLTATGSISESGAGAITGNALVITSQGGQSLSGANAVTSFDSINTGGGTLTLNNTASTLTVIRASQPTGSVSIANAGNIQLGDGTNQGISASGTASISATGKVTDGNGAATNITSAAAYIIGATGVGTALDSIEINTSNLEGGGGTGGFYVTTAGALTIGGVTGANGITTTNSPIAISASGAITLAEDIVAGTGASANITLSAGGLIQETTGIISGNHLTTTSVGGDLLTGSNTVTGFTATNSGLGSAVLLLNSTPTLTVTSITNPTGLVAPSGVNLGGDNIRIVNTGGIDITGALTSGSAGVQGGHITVNSTGFIHLTSTGSADSTIGAGGILTVGGHVQLDGPVTAGRGNITFNGEAGSLVINGPITVPTSLVLMSDDDIIINAAVTTTSNSADLTVISDADNDGHGGTQITALGSLTAGRNLLVMGSDLIITPGDLDGIRIEGAGTGVQASAAKEVLLQVNAVAPASDIWLGGYVRSTVGGSVEIGSNTHLFGTDARVTTIASGSIIFDGTVNGDGTPGAPGALSLVASATQGQIIFAGDVGLTAPVGDVSIDTALAVTANGAFAASSLSILNASDSASFNGPVTLTATGTNFFVQTNQLFVHAPVAAGAGNISWNTDNIDISDDVSGSGTLTIDTLTASRSIGINDISGVGLLNLSAAEIAHLQDGFASIQIGDSNDTGAVIIGGATFLDPVKILSPGGAISINGALVGLGDGAFYLSGKTVNYNVASPAAIISTEGGAVSVYGAQTLLANTLIKTTAGAPTGGDITLDGTVNGNFSLTLDGGTASTVNINGAHVPVNASIGGSRALTSFSVTGGTLNLQPLMFTSGSQTFTGTTSIHLRAGGSHAGAAGITYNGPVIADRAIDIYTTNGNVSFTGSVDSTAGMFGELNIRAGTAAVSFTGAVGNINPLAGLNVTASSGITANSSVNSNGDVTFVTNDIKLLGGASSFHGTGDLHIEPTDNSVPINIGAPGKVAGALTMRATDVNALADGFSTLSFGKSGSIGGLTIHANGATFQDPTTFRQLSTKGVITVAGPLTGTGNASFTFVDLMTQFSSSITTDGGAVILTSAAAKTNFSITTNGGDITLSATLTDSSTAGGRDITFDSGGGAITIAKTVGSTKAPLLGDLTLNSSGVTKLGGTVRAASLTTDAGGVTQFHGTVTTTGPGGQHYGDNVQLLATSTFSSGTAPILFSGTVDTFAFKPAGFAAKTTGAGTITVVGDIGQTSPVGAAKFTVGKLAPAKVTLSGSLTASSLAITANTFTVQDVATDLGQSYSGLGSYMGDLSGSTLKITSTQNIANIGAWEFTGLATLATSTNPAHSITLSGAGAGQTGTAFGSLSVKATSVSVAVDGPILIKAASVTGILTLDGSSVTQTGAIKTGTLAIHSTDIITLNWMKNKIYTLGTISAETGVTIYSGGTNLKLSSTVSSTAGNIILASNAGAKGSLNNANGTALGLGAGAHSLIYSTSRHLTTLGSIVVDSYELGYQLPAAPVGWPANNLNMAVYMAG